MDRQFTTMLWLVRATNLDLINFTQIGSRCLSTPSRKILHILVSLTVMCVNFMSLGHKIFLHHTEVSIPELKQFSEPFSWLKMNQICTHSLAPLSTADGAALQISWGNNPCMLTGYMGSRQTGILRQWAARGYGAMMRVKPLGHDELILPRLAEFRLIKCQNHQESLWPSCLTCDLEKSFIKVFFRHV